MIILLDEPTQCSKQTLADLHFRTAEIMVISIDILKLGITYASCILYFVLSFTPTVRNLVHLRRHVTACNKIAEKQSGPPTLLHSSNLGEDLRRIN